MTKQEALQRIQEYGDILERHIYSNEQFATRFTIYPLIWSYYLLPVRKQGTLELESEEWQRFAEHHYTAIIRCWNVMKTVSRFSDTSTNNIEMFDPAKAQLDFHEAFACFFYFAGAAIENLGKAFDSPVQSKPAFESVYAHQVSSGRNLEWFFKRRHQFIHKALIPCVDEAELISLNISFFDEVDTKWDMTRPNALTDAASLLEMLWNEFVNQMQAVWSKLLDVLKQTPASLTDDVNPETLPHSSGSIHNPAGPPPEPID